MVELFTGLGFQIASVFLFAVFLALLFYFLKEKPVVAVWCGFGAWASMGLAGALYIHSWLVPRQIPATRQEPFHVAIELSMVSDQKGFTGNRFWVAYRSGYGDTVSPVDIPMFIRIVNLQSVPSEISEYKVEMRLGQSEWIKLVNIPVRGNEVFFGSDLTRIRRIDVTPNALDYLLSDRSIQPHETVRGWALFESPTQYFAPMGTEIQYRMTFRDSAGIGSIHMFPVEKTIGPQPPGSSDTVQSRLLYVKEWRDISAFHQKYYHEPVE